MATGPVVLDPDIREALVRELAGLQGLHIFKLGFGGFCRDGPSK